MEITKTELEDFKINPEDVWKEFNCPKYVIHHCFKSEKLPKEIFDFHRQLKLDTHRILQKLDELISDPVTSDSVLRICRLLFDFLNEIGNDGYKIKDLPLIIKVIKFLAENVKTVKEYKLHLNRMLELCNIPPLLEKSSDNLIVDDIMEHYFTLLGDLLIISPTEQQILKIHKILHSLLLKTKIKNIAAVKFEYCRKAMEKSQLPIIIAELLRTSYSKMYEKILQLVFLLSSISYECCYKMLEANILNTILIRMDLPFATQVHCKRPPDMLLSGNEYSDETNLLIINVLWSLMKSFYNEKSINLKNLKKNLIPTHCALWGLCYTFKRQIYYSKYRYFNTKIRNEIAMIILMISINLPSWNLVGSGIADIIIEISIGIETNSVRIFSEIITFGTSIEDLYFEKIILLITTHLAEVNSCLIKKEKLMQTLLQITNPNIKKIKIKWNPSQFWDIWMYAINALSVLAPKMPQQFMDYNGGIRLCMILEWSLDIKFDIKVVMITIKTICIIILNNNKDILEYFRQCGYVFLLIKIIEYILKFDKIRMPEQRVLTLTLLSIEKLMKKQLFYQKIYGEYSVTLSMELLFRCLYQKDQEFKLDQRLLLAIGSYIWECIVWCPENLEKFIHYGGIYIILDIIEIVPYCSHCLFLALFTDMCDNFFCGPFVCTWRGINKNTGLMSLLAKIWREEEIRIKIKKNIDDEELIHMNQKQWFDSYYTRLAKDSSPAIIDMIGSVRSKIYSIYKIIERDNERYLMAKEHYKILNDDLSLEDKITISTINMYFALKLGQVWVEIAKFFEQSGITPLGMDGQAIFLITQRYYMWTEMTKERQIRILQSLDKQKDIEEKDEYARIRNSKLIIALDAFDELDYIYRTTKRSNMLKKKHEQIKQVNLALKFPDDSDDAHCHRTFQDKIMVTAIFNQHQIISSGLKLDTNLSQIKLKLTPISPCDSYISDETYSELSSTSSTCFSNIKKFKEDELLL